MKRAKSRLGKACVTAPVILLIATSVVLGQWSQPAIEDTPMGAEPNFFGVLVGGARDANFPGVWFAGWNNPCQCHGDANNDGMVSLYDFYRLRDAWYRTYGSAGYDPNADFSRDGHVNQLDLIEFARWFFMFPPADCPGTVPWATLVADDFRPMGDAPVTSIDWWGGYFRWNQTSPPAVLPASWQICFWDDVPDGNDTGMWAYSRPGALLKKLEIPGSRVTCTKAGKVSEDWSERERDSVFKYTLDLNEAEYFRPFDYNSPNNIYWLSIMAVYAPAVDANNPWWWFSRPWWWMDGGVKATLYDEPYKGMATDQNRTAPLRNYWYWGQGNLDTVGWWDLAFELGTDPNYIKWQQPYTSIRDWPDYNEIASSGVAGAYGQIVPSTPAAADDWQCQGTNPVTGIVWWGSYIGYQYYPVKEITDPEPFEKPEYFVLSIWTDMQPEDPCTSFSHPGYRIWEYKAYDYDEVMVGYDKWPDGDADACEPVFRYSVDLPEPNWFYQRDINGVFWLKVAAVFDTEPTYQWGWTNHQHVFGDNAVTGEYRVASPTWTKLDGDMSFMLMTDPNYCIDSADYNYDCIVNCVDLDFFADDWRWTGEAGGHCSGDLDCDGDVEFFDLMILADQWLTLTVNGAACTDFDADGYGNPGSCCCPHCERDCNDADSSIHPGAAELCSNGKDDDCDGYIDCADMNCWCIDTDGDGYGANITPCCPYVGVDCNDRDPTIHPGAAEICTDGKDNDCDGQIDCNDPDCDADFDNDGYCEVPGPCCQYTEADCNDRDPAIHPGAAEVCNNGKDDDCDGLIDCADSNCFCADNDGDGYGNPAGPCCQYAGLDCNDADVNVHPGATEICTNGIDDDCDGQVDCADSDCACADSDGDGYGNPPGPCCAHPGVDCNDNDPNINPGRSEVCNDGKDNDCDGFTDCADSNCACIDADGDGYGNPANSCCPYAGLDCNDNDANVFPGATELCKNGIDDDCDGLADCDDGDCTGDPNCPTWPACWSCPTQCHGDADCDGYVGTSDFLLLQAAWLKQYPQFGYNPCADFNRDGRINAYDMAVYTTYFGTNPPADCTPGGTWPPSP